MKIKGSSSQRQLYEFELYILKKVFKFDSGIIKYGTHNLFVFWINLSVLYLPVEYYEILIFNLGIHFY